MDFVENLGVKDKKPIEENGCSFVKSDSAVFHVQVSSHNHETAIPHTMGDLVFEFTLILNDTPYS